MGLGLHSSLSSPVVVLQNPRVREELKLTDAQAARLKVVEEEHRIANRRNFDEIRNKEKELGDEPDPQAKAAYREAARAARAAFSRESEGAYLKVLDRRQRTRLLQIQYQAEGPKAFTRPEVQERLNFSPAQIEQILAIVSQGDLEMARASTVSPESGFEPLRGDAEKRRAQMESKKYLAAVNNVQGEASKTRTSIMRNIAKVLTMGQRANYERMIGETFEFTRSWSSPLATPSTTRERESTVPQQK
jgi:hypothetical protein